MQNVHKCNTPNISSVTSNKAANPTKIRHMFFHEFPTPPASNHIQNHPIIVGRRGPSYRGGTLHFTPVLSSYPLPLSATSSAVSSISSVLNVCCNSHLLISSHDHSSAFYKEELGCYPFPNYWMFFNAILAQKSTATN